ncbi:F-box only protein 43 [Aplochiton taeniatus]
MGALATSTLKPEDMPQSGRKRRLLFSQIKTSSLEDGKCNLSDLSSFERNVSLSDADFDDSIISSNHLSTEMLHTPGQGKFFPSVKENFLTPLNNGLTGNLGRSPSFLSVLSCTPTLNSERSVCEDSGFGSLALEKSQDSLADHDGSFQELLPSSAARARDTPRLAEMKMRSKLELQRRLSTLREGGSQSDEDNGNRARANSALTGKLKQQLLSVSKEDDVFDVKVTPLRTPGAPDASLDELSLTPALQLVHAMCQRNARRTLPEQSSLEELLRLTAASVVATPETFRTTMPLAGLIGRKMGVGKVDVLTELKKRNLRHILAVVLRYLSSEEVYRFGQVSDSWNEIVRQDQLAHHRRKLYVKETKASFELSRASRVPDAETRLTLASRPALKSVQSQARTPGGCTPQSASGTLTPLQHRASTCSSRREEFQLVAKTLFNDECLKSCPRCQRPARCHTVKREGVCSRADCGFQFCTACLRAFHGSKECVSQSGGCSRSKKDLLLPGSAQSKRNLRRL